MAYLSRHPEIRKKLRADIHMDMVGGDPFKNKSILHVTATPWSLPSFVTDVGAALADVIKSAADNYAESGAAPEAAVVENRAGDQGTRNEFLADVKPYSAGSDHDDYDSSTIAVPSLYLADWPDIYIHTDHDTLQQIDPTKLRRVALLGAAAGYVYATLDTAQAQALLPFYTSQAEIRLARLFQQAQQLVEEPKLDSNSAWYEARNLMRQGLAREVGTLHSLAEFTQSWKAGRYERQRFCPIRWRRSMLDRWPGQSSRRAGSGAEGALAGGSGSAQDSSAHRRIRSADISERQRLTSASDAGARGKIKLLNSDATPLLNERDLSELYAYEIVNFIDGKRSVGEIRDAVSAEYGPLPVDVVDDYLEACKEAGVVQWK